MKRVVAAIMMSLVIATLGMAAESAKKMMTKKEVKALVEKASTPSEHNRLAQHYRLEAEKLEAEASEHAEMAKMYRARPTASEAKRPGTPDTASHCETLAENLAKTAKEARALSEAHAHRAKK
jgi:hypothetical protein